MTRPFYSSDFAAAVRDRIHDGSYSDRYISRTDEGVLYLTDSGRAENRISTDEEEETLISEIIAQYAPAASEEEELFYLQELLTSQGSFFHGDQVEEVAAEWRAAGFTADTGCWWMYAGVWMPWVATDLIRMGRIPNELRKIPDDLIYAWCNSDTPVAWPEDENLEESV